MWDWRHVSKQLLLFRFLRPLNDLTTNRDVDLQRYLRTDIPHIYLVCKVVRNKDSRRACFIGSPRGLQLEARLFILCGFRSDVTPIIAYGRAQCRRIFSIVGLLYVDGSVEHTYVRQ